MFEPAEKQVACVGAGIIGRSWAVCFARAGWRVALFDAGRGVVEAALDWCKGAFADLEAAGLIDSADVAFARLAPADSLGAALDGAVYVQESIIEEREAKRALFAEMAGLAAPDTVFGSSTSALPGSQFMADLPISSRCLVAHPTNPPHLIPLVELCRIPQTADESFAFCRDLMTEIGQKPVEIAQEIDGFALNRLQAAVLREALALVERGVISAGDLDQVMKSGLGLRWAFMGPFETGHLNAPGGFRDYLTKYRKGYQSLMDDLHTTYRISPAIVDRIADELELETPPARVAARQRWRDRRLLALRRHLEAGDGDLDNSEGS